MTSEEFILKVRIFLERPSFRHHLLMVGWNNSGRKKKFPYATHTPQSIRLVVLIVGYCNFWCKGTLDVPQDENRSRGRERGKKMSSKYERIFLTPPLPQSFSVPRRPRPQIDERLKRWNYKTTKLVLPRSILATIEVEK